MAPVHGNLLGLMVTLCQWIATATSSWLFPAGRDWTYSIACPTCGTQLVDCCRSGLDLFYSVSYLWYPVIGMGVSFCVGLIASTIISNRLHQKIHDTRCGWCFNTESIYRHYHSVENVYLTHPYQVTLLVVPTPLPSCQCRLAYCGSGWWLHSTLERTFYIII